MFIKLLSVGTYKWNIKKKKNLILIHFNLPLPQDIFGHTGCGERVTGKSELLLLSLLTWQLWEERGECRREEADGDREVCSPPRLSCASDELSERRQRWRGGRKIEMEADKHSVSGVQREELIKRRKRKPFGRDTFGKEKCAPKTFFWTFFFLLL